MISPEGKSADFPRPRSPWNPAQVSVLCTFFSLNTWPAPVHAHPWLLLLPVPRVPHPNSWIWSIYAPKHLRFGVSQTPQIHVETARSSPPHLLLLSSSAFMHTLLPQPDSQASNHPGLIIPSAHPIHCQILKLSFKYLLNHSWLDSVLAPWSLLWWTSNTFSSAFLLKLHCTTTASFPRAHLTTSLTTVNNSSH